ncbi:spore germination protein [Limnochorda pilosa]|uniref:Spore gernimation protein GerA n=1 Tax=Limnochorda pilosa TaxID=1555112 RepID=A0A0K2SLC7_LIMPI|nr:spore germination protein [Limnochorda pilosa]BAS27639.1 spore gernimation protein GerA [Limnochorda pilosa]
MARQPAKVQRSLQANLKELGARLGFETNFDVVVREIEIGGRKAALVFVDGFVKDVFTRILGQLQSMTPRELAPDPLAAVLERGLPYVEVETTDLLDQVVDSVLAGPTAILIDGVSTAILVDARTYPSRAVDEPDLERVTRGARDGFTETVVQNTALIRRRIRDPRLRFEILRAGTRSQTDVVVGYINDLADPRLVQEVKGRIQAIETDSVVSGARSIEEFILGRSLNPLPRARYTERPDVAAAHLWEGHVVVLTDTGPTALILPANLWHFTQHAEEYFQNPVVGTYLRWIRMVGIVLSLFLLPVWLILAQWKGPLPGFLDLLGPKESAALPLLVQFLLLELGVDLIRMALIHVPNALATSLGIVGAVLLGQLAVEVGLFVPETILYTAIALLGFFATPSQELALAFRLFRYVLLLAAGLAGWQGLVAASILFFIFLASSESLTIPYLWPLIPFDWEALRGILFRSPVPSVRRRTAPAPEGRSPEPSPA